VNTDVKASFSAPFQKPVAGRYDILSVQSIVPFDLGLKPATAENGAAGNAMMPR
jgi:hypothetical protein